MVLLHTFRQLLFGVFLVMVAFTAYSDVNVATYQTMPKTSQPIEISRDSNIDKGMDDSFYLALVAELYNLSGEAGLTLDYYLPLALKSRDSELVKHVTEIATGSGQLKKGLKVAKHWVNLNPDSLEARQYLTLLFLRDKQLKKSAGQLQFIREIVEKNSDEDNKQLAVSNGLKFIGALLVEEAHHKKAFSVFNHYIKKHGSTKYVDQQNLILASLAMKAKQFAVVVSALKGIEESISPYFASAGLMKSKALQKLGKLKEASILLKRIVKTEETSDSLRLELARLLIRVNEKQEASTLLKSLVAKYPDNNDLLKSLIALDIDQQNWLEAKQNNHKLGRVKAYKNDADYFYGEISEAQGNFKEALISFKKVKRGGFKKRSHNKIALLIVQLESVDAAREWLQSRQQKAIKVIDKVHWIKLEADLLSNKSSAVNKNNLEDALKLYNKVISLLPKKTRNYYYRGLLLERLNQIGPAEKDFKKLLEKQNKNADALNALGFLLVKHTTRFEEAKKYIQQAHKIKPNDPTIMDSLGWVYFQTGEIKTAETFLRKAFKSLRNQEVADHLIAVLTKSGQQQEAKIIFDEMKKKYPNKVKKSKK